MGEHQGVDLGQGLPDLDLVPADDLRQCFASVLSGDDRAPWGYFGAGGPLEMRAGCVQLRRAVADLLFRRDGRDLGPEGVVLVHGSTDGLATAVDAFCAGAGEGTGTGTDALGAVIEETTFHHMARFLGAAGAVVERARLDGTGVVPGAIDAAFDRLEARAAAPSLVYTIPSFHSPTATLLPLDRRRALIDIAARRGAVVLEDACYHDLHFDAPPPPTLLALDRHDVVVQSGTFSKLLAPGLRLGWLAGPPELVARIVGARRDFSVDRVSALAVARYLESGKLEPHVERLRAAYRSKRDVAVEALRRHCAPLVTFDIPAGGFYLWLLLDPAVDVEALGRRASAEGLGLRTGDVFGGAAYQVPALRLSVAQVPVPRIEPAIALLGRILAEVAH